jgi:4-hydroxybenzoate polyprenyltransferase
MERRHWFGLVGITAAFAWIATAASVATTNTYYFPTETRWAFIIAVVTTVVASILYER